MVKINGRCMPENLGQFRQILVYIGSRSGRFHCAYYSYESTKHPAQKLGMQGRYTLTTHACATIYTAYAHIHHTYTTLTTYTPYVLHTYYTFITRLLHIRTPHLLHTYIHIHHMHLLHTYYTHLHHTYYTHIHHTYYTCAYSTQDMHTSVYTVS